MIKIFARLKRRKRNMAYLTMFGTLFFLALMMVFQLLSKEPETYRPGEEIEGLTAALERPIPRDHPEVIFSDITREAGIHFRHFPAVRSTQLPEDMGSGASWGDYNNDGWDDLFIANFSGNMEMDKTDFPDSSACRLYRNNRDGTFTEVGQQTGLNVKDYVNGATWLDFNRDGLLDIFLTTYGGLHLFRNSGQDAFIEVTDNSSLNGYTGFWTGAAAADYDRDGFVDIYVCGYVDYHPGTEKGGSLQYKAEVPASLNPSSFPPAANLLFRNNKDGTFSEVADTAGVKNENGRSLSAAWVDLDSDDWPDLYVANDVSDNALFRNKGDGTFEDISYPSLVADYRGAMGIGIGDWDNDEDLDLFITHWMAQENALYTNLHAQLASMGDSLALKIRFMDEADRYGLGQIALEDIGFGTAFLDFDNDGRLDIFIANGSTFQERDKPENLVPMHDRIFWNRGPEEGFYDVSGVSGAYFKRRYVGRGAAVSDYDRDGDPDLFITNHGGSGILLRNDGGNMKNWLEVNIPSSFASEFPGRIKLKLTAGNLVQVREVGIQGSYLSQHSLTVHFGLGDHEYADTLKIALPGSRERIFTNLESNRVFDLSALSDYIP